jgi:RNA polymerase sigma-70 factor (ECF subfamily)
LPSNQRRLPSDSSSPPQTESCSDVPNADRTERLVQYEPWLRLLARREIDSRFRGKFSASDAVQQTMVEAWKGWQHFRGEVEPQRRAWLRQILAHQLARLARQYAGTQKRDIAREANLQRSLAESAARLENVLPADVSSPSDRAIRDEQQLQLAAALEQLPRDYRVVIILRHIEHLPYTEIARRMERSEGAVRMLWVRALAQLRQEVHSSGNANQSRPS